MLLVEAEAGCVNPLGPGCRLVVTVSHVQNLSQCRLLTSTSSSPHSTPAPRCLLAALTET
eukprot:m.15153 g.15153  ORF g.15153 m.15153 type:complete len:60 (+) comp4879_c0_seq1:245-424(+)